MCHLPGIRSAVTDFRTARSFGGDTQQWLDLQIAHDLKQAKEGLASEFNIEVTPFAGDAVGSDSQLVTNCHELK